MTDVRLSTADQIGNASRMTSQVERETMPVVTLNKAMLAIVADSIEVSFTKFGGNLWRYEANPSHPTLAPLINARMSTAEKQSEDTSWKGFFDQLVQNLPEDVATRFVKENALPRDERSPAYTALGNLLQTTAKALAWMEAASKPENPESPSFRHANAVSQMGALAEQNIDAIGNNFLLEAKSFLDGVGANYAHFDKLTNNFTQVEKALTELSNLRKKGSD